MDDVEQARTRLTHIRTVQPILGALRTVSLGSWQMALRRMADVQSYGEQLTALLPLLVPHLPAGRWPGAEEDAAKRRPVVMMVVGSERGLVGRFNRSVTDLAEQVLVGQRAAGVPVELMALGTRLVRILSRQVAGAASSAGQPLTWSGQLATTTLPSYRLAFELTRGWLLRYERREIDAVYLVYNAYRGADHYESALLQLIPPQPAGPEHSAMGEPWPPVIVETDPLSLYVRVVGQGVAVRMYGVLLDSAAAEHAARYRLMESATQNAGRLIDELKLLVQSARRKAITEQLQELSVGAGLIGSRPGRG